MRNKTRNYKDDGDARRCDGTQHDATYYQTAGRAGRAQVGGRELTLRPLYKADELLLDMITGMGVHGTAWHLHARLFRISVVHAYCR